MQGSGLSQLEMY